MVFHIQQTSPLSLYTPPPVYKPQSTLDESLTSHDGRIKKEAWDAYFHRIFSYSERPIDDVIRELNHLLKIATKKIAQVHFPLDTNISTVVKETYQPDWRYFQRFQPHLAAV